MVDGWSHLQQDICKQRSGHCINMTNYDDTMTSYQQPTWQTSSKPCSELRNQTWSVKLVDYRFLLNAWLGIHLKQWPTVVQCYTLPVPFTSFAYGVLQNGRYLKDIPFCNNNFTKYMGHHSTGLSKQTWVNKRKMFLCPLSL